MIIYEHSYEELNKILNKLVSSVVKQAQTVDWTSVSIIFSKGTN